MKNINQIKSKIKEQLNEGRTLVYFASGTNIRNSYQDLPYENVFLVDRSFKKSHRSKNFLETQGIHIKGRVISLRMDCLEVIYLFKLLELKIDCFVAINEGLYEGGGHYALNSDSFLGYAFQVLADTCLHIGYKEYYSGPHYHHLREHWLDIPYNTKKVLSKNDDEYISPAIFTNRERYATNAEVTLLSEKSARQHTFQLYNKEIRVCHSSIWEDMNERDASFVRFENRVQHDVIIDIERSQRRGENRIFPLYVYKFQNYSEMYTTYNFDAIIALCETNDWKHIGLVPNQGDYKMFIEKIVKSDNRYPEKISFYHLNKNDFAELYKML